MEIKKYRWSIITLIVIIGVSILLIAVGYSIGVLSADPDGLERSINDAMGEEYLEGLPSVWNPILGWIENEFLAGTIGIILAFTVMITIFYLIIFFKKKKRTSL